MQYQEWSYPILTIRGRYTFLIEENTETLVRSYDLKRNKYRISEYRIMTIFIIT
jgi:hypothetical protein